MSAELTMPPKVIFTTGLIDKSGNKYDTIIIDNKEWLVQNYRTTKYADGSTIPLVEDSIAWAADTTGAMCYYNNAAYHADTYGALYNYFAIENANGFIYLERDGVEETGWRMPTDSDPWNPLPGDSTTDFELLEAAHGGGAIAGKALKEVGTAHWRTPNTGTDSSGFKALPSGARGDTGTYSWMSLRSIIWTAKEGGVNYTSGRHIMRRMDYNYDYLQQDYAYPDNSGLAVRLVRDLI